MVIKLGKNGQFLACSNYPACKNTQNFTRSEDGQIIRSAPKETETDIPCEHCGKPMVVKEGRFGPFLGLFRLSGMQDHCQHRQGRGRCHTAGEGRGQRCRL